MTKVYEEALNTEEFKTTPERIKDLIECGRGKVSYFREVATYSDGRDMISNGGVYIVEVDGGVKPESMTTIAKLVNDGKKIDRLD